MPDYKRQFRYLLPFLAELHESLLARVAVEQLCYPLKQATVIVAHVCLDVCRRRELCTGVVPTVGMSGGVVVCRRDSLIVILLSNSSCSGGSLGLGMLMAQMAGHVALVMPLLLAHPGPAIVAEVVLVGEGVGGMGGEHLPRRMR